VGVKLVEVVGGVVEPVVPVEAEPPHVRDDRLDVLDLFLGGIGVVEAQVAEARVIPRDAEVQADRLGVADVEVSVRLRRKAGDDLAPVLPRPVVLVDDLADEVPVGGFRFGFG